MARVGDETGEELSFRSSLVPTDLRHLKERGLQASKLAEDDGTSGLRNALKALPPLMMIDHSPA